MKIERLTFKNQEGHTLAARLYLPLDESPQFFTVFAHCFTCSKNFKAVNNISDTLANLGVAVLSFDFTGLGDSEGEFENSNFSTNVQDLIAAAKFLEKNYEAPRLMIGHSLGGTAVVIAASQLDCVEAVVTIGSPANPDHVKRLLVDVEDNSKAGSRKINIGGRSFLVNEEFIKDLDRHQLPDRLSKMRKAILILHSPQDKIVDISNAAALYQNAFHPKSFITLDGADHLLSDSSDSLYAGQIIHAWVKKYLPGQKKQDRMNGHQVRVRLFGDSYTSEIKTPFHHLLADEPEEVGGKNLGPTPYDLLMASLGSCTVMTLKMYAQRKGWDLQEILVFLDHDKVHQEDSVSFEKETSKVSRFTRILEIKGELDEAKKTKLLEIADKCPVHRTLHEDIIIETRFKE